MLLRHKITNNFSKIVTIYNKISKKSSNIAIFHHLYVENFPENERREWSEELSLVDNDSRFHVVTACRGSQVAGFVTYWTFEGFNYIEHLAVDASCRCQGIGASLLAHASAMGQPLLLEVDLPDDGISLRRIRFYEKRGLVAHEGIKYMQPPYGQGKPSVPMMIMTSPTMTQQQVLMAIDVLRKEVYRCR